MLTPSAIGAASTRVAMRVLKFIFDVLFWLVYWFVNSIDIKHTITDIYCLGHMALFLKKLLKPLDFPGFDPEKPRTHCLS
jgi:hypothetical protein